MAENFIGLTHQGRVRDNNEDTFIAEKLKSSGLIAACVIDGVGGYEGGEVAAAIARDTLLEKLQGLAAMSADAMRQAFILANQRIYEENRQRANSEPMACVCTLAVADIANNELHYAHVGDTRLYLLRDHSLVKLTKDHSFVGFLEDSGRLTEEEAMRHPKRNEINKALGFDPQIELQADYIETGTSPFLPGDMLLLCSDGLTDMVTLNNITDILVSPTSLPEKCNALIEAANNAGGKDNVTAVLVHNNKKPVKTKATRPASVKKNEEEAREVIAQQPAEPVKISKPRRKGRSGSVTILAVLCVTFLAGFLWQWLGNRTFGTHDGQPAVERNRNAAEKKLQDSLDHVGNGALALYDSVYGNLIKVSDTLYIISDSLHVRGRGMTLRADSAFKGPAMIIYAGTSHVVLEDITLENFETGIIAQGPNVYFINVRFVNCRTPVQYQSVILEDRTLSGALLDSVMQTDSLH